MVIMIAGNSVEQVVPGPDFTAGVKNVTVPEGRLVVPTIILLYVYVYLCPRGQDGTMYYSTCTFLVIHL